MNGVSTMSGRVVLGEGRSPGSQKLFCHKNAVHVERSKCLKQMVPGSTFNPFRTAVPFLGQTSQNSSSLSPKRDCGSKGVKPILFLLDMTYRINCAAINSHYCFRNYGILGPDVRLAVPDSRSCPTFDSSFFGWYVCTCAFSTSYRYKHCTREKAFWPSL